MKAASVHELKKELSSLSPQAVEEICVRLIKYKKENKELVTYLLFEAQHEAGFIQELKEEIDKGFDEINRSNLYLVKKSVRKILRNINKNLRYSGIDTTAAEVLIYFCAKLKHAGIAIHKSQQLTNLYEGQVKKIHKIVSGMHEDLQYDYKNELNQLR